MGYVHAVDILKQCVHKLIINGHITGTCPRRGHIVHGLHTFSTLVSTSATEHQRERQLVMKQEHITPKDIGRFGLIYIALADLRDDGVQEIFVYEDAPGFCGTLGCPFDIYQVGAHGLVSLMDEGSASFFLISIDFDKSGHQKVFGVLQSKTMGWHDIVLHDEELFRWRWKKDHYEGAEPLH